MIRIIIRDEHVKSYIVSIRIITISTKYNKVLAIISFEKWCVWKGRHVCNFINHLVDQLRIRYEMMEILFQSPKWERKRRRYSGNAMINAITAGTERIGSKWKFWFFYPMFAPLATKARPLTKSTRSKTVPTDRGSIVFNKSTYIPGEMRARTYASRERILAYDGSTRERAISNSCTRA